MRVSSERDWSIVIRKSPGKYLFFPYKHSSIVDCLILRVLCPSLFRLHGFFFGSRLAWRIHCCEVSTSSPPTSLTYIYAMKLTSPLRAFIHNFTSPLCALCFRIYFHFRNKIKWWFQKPRPSIEADTDWWAVFSIVLMDTLMEFSLSPVLRWSRCRGLSLIN